MPGYSIERATREKISGTGVAARPLPLTFLATSCMPASLPASLLLGDVADHGQLEHLSLVGLEHQNQPDHKPGQTDQRPHKDCCPPEKWDVANECQDDPEHGPCDRKKDALKGMEADESLLVERLQHQKNNRRNDGHVG